MKKKVEYIIADEELVKKISEKFGVSELVATIIANRGIVNDDDIEIFLNPTRNNFYDPFDLPDMKKAIERIEKAIEKLS